MAYRIFINFIVSASANIRTLLHCASLNGSICTRFDRSFLRNLFGGFFRDTTGSSFAHNPSRRKRGCATTSNDSGDKLWSLLREERKEQRRVRNSLANSSFERLPLTSFFCFFDGFSTTSFAFLQPNGLHFIAVLLKGFTHAQRAGV